MNLKGKYLTVFLIVLLFTLLAVITVSAAVTWETVTGPTYSPPSDYEFTIGASISNPQNYICILYTIPDAPETSNLCTDPDADNTWDCVIPGNYPDVLISYRFAGYANANCSGSGYTTGAPSGDFTTGPTAVELSSFTTENQQDRLPLLTSIVIVFLVVVILAGGLFWNHKSRIKQ